MAESDEESLVTFPECSICFNPFDDEEPARKPRIGTCAHSVCDGCVTKWKNDCPMCRTVRSFTKIKYNFALMAQISKQKKKARAINQLVADNKKKDKKILQLEADVKESKKFEGFTCSKCSFPMMEDAAFVCTTCLPSKLKISLEADDFDFDCDFDDMCKLVNKLLCGGCILKNHRNHSSQALHTIQIQKKVGKLKDQVNSALSKTDKRLVVMCGKTGMIQEIEEMHTTLKSITVSAAQALASSSSLKEFENKKSQLNRVVRTVDEATDGVIKGLYQLKQCLEDAISTVKQISPGVKQRSRFSSSTKDFPSSPAADMSFPCQEMMPSSSRVDYSFSLLLAQDQSPFNSRPNSPLLSESTLMDDGVPSPSWPTLSCTSQPVIYSGILSESSSSEPSAKRQRRNYDTPQRTFKFLNIDDSTLRDLTAKVEALEGCVVPSGDFNPKDVTHVICSKMTPTVSFYCLVAKGCWFLKEEYINDCAEVGQWLQEEMYEWGNPNITHSASLTTDELLLVGAAQRWRRSLSDSGWNTLGAFSEWRVLLYTTPEKSKTLQPILASGGAFVVVRRYYQGSVTEFQPTHVFVESGVEMDKTELDEVVKAGGKVLIPEFIWNHLQDEDIIQDHYFHEDFNDLQNTGSQS